MGRRGRCRDCGQPVDFIPSAATGNTMCLDPYPQPGGNVRYRHVAEGLVADVLSDSKAEQEADLGVPLYKVHQATCPHLHPPVDDDAPRPVQLKLGGG